MSIGGGTTCESGGRSRGNVDGGKVEVGEQEEVVEGERSLWSRVTTENRGDLKPSRSFVADDP